MGTKNNPGKFDCYVNADPNEPMFVLLGRDGRAAELVRMWARERKTDISFGMRPPEDMAQVEEALACAQAMEDWFDAKIGADEDEKTWHDDPDDEGE